MANTRDRALLKKIVSLPTAPLHEDRVVAFVRSFAADSKLRCRQDHFGNLYLSNCAPGPKRLTVAAHMDHPGVEVVRSKEKVVVVQILGGLFCPQLSNARFIFFPLDSPAVVGRTAKVLDQNHLELSIPGHLPRGTFGMLNIEPAVFKQGLLYSRVIDNLAGCAAVLVWLKRHARSRIPLSAILTRAEEIGFVGAANLVRLGKLPMKTPLVVLEASSAKIARVNIGGGPVVRVGDRMTTFDSTIECWLHDTAARLAKRRPNFTYQRALMAGGAMEASLYGLQGAKVGALALPLGNYHNRGARGVSPEIISVRDWENLGLLLNALVRAPAPQKVIDVLRRRLMKNIK